MPTNATLQHNRMLTEITFEIKSGRGRGQGVDKAVGGLLKCDEVYMESVSLTRGNQTRAESMEKREEESWPISRKSSH